MSRVALDLGIVQIYWYSICILLGMMAGMFVVYRESKKKGINETLITNLIFYTIIVAIIGARLYYVIFDFNYYSKNPLEILELWNGGLAIHGAIILGGLFVIYYTKQHKMNILKILDICSAGVIIGQAIGRWGNFFNQEVFGGEVSLEFLKGLHLPGFIIDGMHIGGNYYQPLFLYESIWCLIGFVIIILVRRRKYIKTGQIFGIYCMWYSLGRFFFEGMRDEKYNLMLGSLKVAQVVSIGMFVVGLFFFVRRLKSARFEFLYNEEGIKTEVTDNDEMTQSFFKKKTKEKKTKMNISGENKTIGNATSGVSQQPSAPILNQPNDNPLPTSEAPTMNLQPNNPVPTNETTAVNLPQNGPLPVSNEPAMNLPQNNTVPTSEAPTVNVQQKVPFLVSDAPVMNNQQSQTPIPNQPLNNQNISNPFENVDINQNKSNNTFL